MIKYYVVCLLVIISFSSGDDFVDSLAGSYCYPDCEKFDSILILNSDHTFNFNTSRFKGNSRWGSWELLDNHQIKLKTLKIQSRKSFQMPPHEIIHITSERGLKKGKNLFVKNTELLEVYR